MSPVGVLQVLASLLTLYLSLAQPIARTNHHDDNELEYSIQSFKLVQEVVSKRSSECSLEELESILQGCEESVTPGDTSVATRFCGSMCKEKVMHYAHTCSYPNFSLNVTGTCLVNSIHSQCIFAVILVRPGIVSCTASAVASNDEPSTAVYDSSVSPHCNLVSSYNTTGEYYQIELDTSLMRPVIRPSLEPPWNNCCEYYQMFGEPPQINNQKRTVSPEPTIECSQSQLKDIIQDCENAVKPTDILEESISRRFCGGSCKSRVAAYAAVCNMTDFSLNITGSCLTDSSEAQCIFAVILIRPGISSCSATSVNSNQTVSAVQAYSSPCCVLHTMVNTTAEFFSIVPDPQTGAPVINPPLAPPWESCSTFTASMNHTCELTTTELEVMATSMNVRDQRTTSTSDYFTSTDFSSYSSTPPLYAIKQLSFLLPFVCLIIVVL